MKSKTAETLVAKETSVDGRRLNFFNSVAVAKGPYINDVTQNAHMFGPLPPSSLSVTQPISTIVTFWSTPSPLSADVV